MRMRIFKNEISKKRLKILFEKKRTQSFFIEN